MLTSAEHNKALVRRFYEEIDKGNIDILDQLVAEDYVDHNPPPFPGLASGSPPCVAASHRLLLLRQTGGRMRTLMKVQIPVEAGNKARQSGTLESTLKATMERLRPEAAYFFPENGVRTAMLVFDLKDTSELPQITEPLFTQFNARVEFFPVMNAEDLQKGLKQIAAGV